MLAVRAASEEAHTEDVVPPDIAHILVLLLRHLEGDLWKSDV
jgi:hypothetical protein